MTNDLQEHKAKKQGQVTPLSLLKELVAQIESGDIEVTSLALVYRSDDTEYSSWTVNSHREGLGMVDILHHNIMRDYLGGLMTDERIPINCIDSRYRASYVRRQASYTKYYWFRSSTVMDSSTNTSLVGNRLTSVCLNRRLSRS